MTVISHIRLFFLELWINLIFISHNCLIIISILAILSLYLACLTFFSELQENKSVKICNNNYLFIVFCGADKLP